MSYRSRTLGLVMVGALALAACGGSDDSSGGSDDASDGSAADGAVAEATDESAGETTDDDGGGSSDEAQENLDDAGVDIDLDELEETITGLSTGEGGGVVTIDGVSYEYVAEICISQGTDFVATGPSVGPDGIPAWIEVDASEDFDFDGDGTDDRIASVRVTVGQSELFGDGADDQPRFSSESLLEEMTYTLDGGRMTGSGEMGDRNGVALEYGETLPFTFEASCS